MKPLLVIIPLLTATLVVLARVLYIAFFPIPSFNPDRTIPKTSPPKEAIALSIQQIQGAVNILARHANAFAPLEMGKAPLIYQGEILATEDMASITLVSNDTNIQLMDNTEVEFAHLVYPGILLRHRRGSAIYAATMTSFSIRSLSALIELGTGEVSINTQGDIVDVQLIDGVATIGMIDANNDTHVWKVTPGQRVRIDNETRRVTVTGRSPEETE